MNADRGRDQSIEPLLRRSLRADVGAPVSDACLDGETLAAWVDGGLDQHAIARAEAHVAGCARCQALVGVMARSAPEPAAAVPWWRSSVRVRWLVPLAAGAVAVALWVMVPGRVPSPAADRALPPATLADQAREVVPAPSVAPPGTRADESRAAAAGAAPAAGARAAAGPPAAPVPSEAPRPESFAPEVPPAQPRPTLRASHAPPRVAEESAAAEKRAATGAELGSERPLLQRNRRAENSVDDLKRAAEPTLAAPPPPAAARPAPTLKETVMVGAAAAPQASLCGPAWRVAPTGVTVELTAGSSPSASVCWMIGRAGTVLLSTDGRTWQRVPFPEAVDLKTVQAIDARTATVTTIDGRTFRTTDGGKSWNVPSPPA